MTNLAFVLRFPSECEEGVTRRDEFQPCDKPAVAVRMDPGFGEFYPVCARHARADMVPLPDLISAVRAQVAVEIEAALPPSVVTIGSEVYVAGIRDGLHTAARIAGGTP